MKRLFSFFTVFVMIFVLASCKTKEESVIADLNNLCERIENKGENFSAEDWEDVASEYAEIHDRVSDCDFTTEQLEEVGKAEGKIVMAVTTQGGKGLLKKGEGLIKGFLEGIAD